MKNFQFLGGFLSILLLTSSLMADPAVQINSTDAVAGNEVNCMASIFEAALGLPLSSVTLQENTFRSPEIKANPADKNNLAIIFTRDGTRDSSGTFFRLNMGGLIAFSRDGGKTWSQSVPTEIKCLGGSLSDLVRPISIDFSKKGSLYYFAQATGTQTAVAPNNNILFVQRSDDGGASWTSPTIVDTQNTSVAFQDTTGFLNNPTGAIFADPLCDSRVHTVWSTILAPDLIYGNVVYAQSNDKGATFSPATTIYTMGNDPRWLTEHGSATCFCQPDGCDQSGCSAPNTPPLICGGQTVAGSMVSVPNKKAKSGQTLLISILRFYPAPLPNMCYTQFPPDSLFDHAVISSCDNGKNWSQSASPLSQYNFATAFDPRTVPNTDTLIIFDGALNSPMAVSPKTDRVYMAWEGGNPEVNADPVINQFYPTIQLAVSDNAGKTWSGNVQVSRTPLITVPANPTDTQLLAAAPCQGFNPNITVLANGLLGVIYTDFRNFTAIPAQNTALNVVPATIWLAVYKETCAHNGGSTGIGLDFVGETLLAEFNAAIGFGYNTADPSGFPRNPLQGIGGLNGIDALGCNFITAYGVTNQGDLFGQPGSVNPAQPIFVDPNGVNVDPNNRLNIFFQKVTS